jgi:hypothetical protein
MSGCSYTTSCPRCGGTLYASADYKPLDVTSGICVDCGLGYQTVDAINTLEAVNEFRENFELPRIEQLCQPTQEWLDAGYEPIKEDGFIGLYMCRYEFRTGEEEYSSDHFIRASSDDDAQQQALAFLKQIFGDETRPFDPNEPDSWQENEMGYPICRLAGIEKVNSLEDIIHRITLI